MPAATAHATIRHDASGLRAARAHVAHLFVRSGGSYRTCFVLFVCEANDTDYDYVACFWCSFADSECAFCAGYQLRLRTARPGIMHRGCGRPVRTLRTFSYDRAAPVAPVLHFLCAKEMTPIMWPAFGAPLLVRIALSALDASCDCAWHDQASCIGAADGPCARCAPFVTIGRLLWHLFCTFLCAKQMTPITCGLLLVLLC